MPFQIKYSLFLLIFHSFYSIENADVNYRVAVNKFICRSFTENILNITCNMRKVNSTHQSFNFFIQLKPNYTLNSLMASTSLYQRNRVEIKFHPYIGMVNLTMDVCRYLKAEDKNFIFDMIADDFKKHGNLLDPCPKQGTIYVKDAVLTYSNFLRIAPLDEFMFHAVYFEKQRKKEQILLDVKVTAELKASRN